MHRDFSAVIGVVIVIVIWIILFSTMGLDEMSKDLGPGGDAGKAILLMIGLGSMVAGGFLGLKIFDILRSNLYNGP